MKTWKNNLSRRHFLANAAAISSLPVIAACSGNAKTPLSADVNISNPDIVTPSKQTIDTPWFYRSYGNTGMKVSTIGFGCGSRFNSMSDVDKILALDAAIAGGINYFDTASEYNNTAFLGKYFHVTHPELRERVYIVNKLNARDYAGAKVELTNQLNEFKSTSTVNTYFDVVLCHAIPNDATDPPTLLATIEAGVWKYLTEAKTAGTAKFIGFSSMDSTAANTVCKDFITNLNPDVCSLSINAAKTSEFPTFKTHTMPAANAANIGVAAFNTLLGMVTPTNTAAANINHLLKLRDAKNNPAISTLIIGHDKGAIQVQENIAIAKALDSVVEEVMDIREFERNANMLNNPNNLAWQRPDFRDNGEIYNWS